MLTFGGGTSLLLARMANRTERLEAAQNASHLPGARDSTARHDVQRRD